MNIKILFLFGFVFSQDAKENRNSPLHVLNTIKKQNNVSININQFNPKWTESLNLLLPCEGINVPKRSARLPNAPRDYRSGTHRGIDFFARWGTEIRAVEDGVIIRSDLNYKEVPADFRKNLLHVSSKVGHTPSDIFNSILLGKAVFIDHGLNLVKGFRVITIYAHMSYIEKKLIPGTTIKRGEKIGLSGNTGTKDSTLGSKSGAHLHWEFILQRNNKEIYLGEGMESDSLYKMLSTIFVNR